MFGRRTTGRRSRRGVFSGSNLRNAALAGAGMLALRWWRNRQASNRTPGTDESTRPGSAGQTNWS